MAKQEVIPTSNNNMLLALITSIQSLTLTLQANLQSTSVTPPPTAPAASTSTDSAAGSAAVPTTAAPTTAPTTAAPTTAPAVPAILPIVAPQAGPIPPPATFGQLAEVYLTPLACSSQGVHPTVLHALPEIVSAAETGPWFVVTVGQYTGVYQEWHQVSPLVTGWSAACYRRHSTKASALAAYDNA